MKAEKGYLTSIIIKCRYNIFCRIDLFPLFIPSIPIFHYSIIPCGFPMWMATKNIVYSLSCRISEMLGKQFFGFIQRIDGVFAVSVGFDLFCKLTGHRPAADHHFVLIANAHGH